MPGMAGIKRFDHIGITVDDLDAAAAFFVNLGMEEKGRTFLEGEFLDQVVGLTDAKTEILMVGLPEGGTTIELATYLRPGNLPLAREHMSNDLGVGNLAFEVDDVDALIEQLAQDGYPLIGGIAEHEGQWRMCSVRGPGGTIVSLAQRLS
jgi:catechol 2,3-dioxygenase-like lactoylglutathione lyase family enzyme